MRVALAAVVVAVAAVPALATVVQVPTLAEMTWRSDVIVHAWVVDQQVLEQKKGRIVTRTVLEVEDGLAGANDKDLVVVEQLGGELGAHRAWIAGAHKFKVGDEVVFFGVRIDNVVGEPVVVPYGIGFGIFDVLEDVDGKHAVERGGDVANLVRTPDGKSHMEAVKPRHYRSVDDLKREVRAILDGRDVEQPALLQLAPPKKLPPPPSPLRRPSTSVTK